MRLGGFGPERHRPLQVGEGGRELSLLPQNEAQEAVGVRMALVQAERLRELRSGGGQVATPRGLVGALVEIVGRARRLRARLAGGGALLPERHAERVVSLAQLGVDLDRLLQGGHGGGQIASLTEGLAQFVVDAGVGRIGLGHLS